MNRVIPSIITVLLLASLATSNADDVNLSKVTSAPDYPPVKKIQEHTIVNRSPELFADYLRRAKDYVDQHKLQPWLITINSRNGWSEGSYLEPDERDGRKCLEALRAV